MASDMRAGVGARILAVAMCASCGSRAAAPATGGVVANAGAHRVMIAVVAPTRGDASALGAESRAAVALAIDDLRDDASRSLPVAALEVLEVDAGDGEIDATVTAAHIVRGRTDVIAVIAALPEASVTALAAALEDSEAAMIPTTTSSRRAIDIDIATGPIDEAEIAGRVIGEYLHARQPGVLTSMGETMTPAVFAFEQSVARYATKPVEQSFPFTHNGGIDPLGELAAAGVDAVFVASMSDELARALREAQLHQLTAAFVLPSTWDTVRTRDEVDRSGVHAYLLVPFAADDGTDRARDFANRFRQRTGAVPDTAAVMAYDATEVAITAVLAADNPIDPKSVAAAMHGLADVPGLSGELAVDRQGHAHRALAVRDLHGGDQVVTRIGP